MTEWRWVVNASPLIFLAQINALPLLKHLAEEVRVPVSVRVEVLAKKPIELPHWLTLKEDLPLPPKSRDGILEPASLRFSFTHWSPTVKPSWMIFKGGNAPGRWVCP